MFFDKQGPDLAYRELLVAIARSQQELLANSFDWAERTAKPIPQKRGFFGKKPLPDPACQQLLAQLETLKEQLKIYRTQKGYADGIFWWSIPWEQVEYWLICDLEQPKANDGWRFETELHTAGRDGIYLLYLKEEGHLSNFSSSRVYSVQEKSEYSSGERADMVRNYNRRITNYDLWDLALSNDAPVHSTLSGADYTSKADYYLSSEYFMTRQYLSDSYAKRLYTQVETVGVTAVSNSLHYECFYKIADFHVREDGTLDHMGIRNFELISARGNTPDFLSDKYQDRDAAVVCAGFLADNEQIRQVPLALFGKDMEQGAATYEEAMRQAEIYTCLAKKIS